MKLTQVGVVMLGVKDLARSVAFYSGTLGLPLAQQIPGFAFFNAGGFTLALSEPIARNSPQIVGATEIVFSVDDVRAAYAALKEKGVVFIQEPRVVNPPMWAANFNDPDGHRLSVYGPEHKA